MKVTRILISMVGFGLILWGLLGIWAASLPEDGVPTDDFWRSGLIELALGVSLLLLAWRLRLRATSSGGAS